MPSLPTIRDGKKQTRGTHLGAPRLFSLTGAGCSGHSLGRVLLANGNGPADVFGIVLVAPEAERLGLEKVEEEPGEAFLVDKGEKGLALDGIQARDAKVLKFLQGLLVAEVGALGGLQGVLVGDESGAVGSAGAVGNTASVAPLLLHFQPVLAKRAEDGPHIG